VNLLKNHISVAQAKNLVSILKEHPTLKSLCGNKGDETKLDMSGKISGADDVIMFAGEIVDNGALTSLDISDNRLGGSYDGFTLTATPEGPKAIADAIKDVGALTLLNLSSNSLKVEGAKIFAEAVKVTNCAILRSFWH
jgi:hypothetical protein